MSLGLPSFDTTPPEQNPTRVTGSASLAGLTAAVSATTIFSPVADGMYRMSAFAQCTTAGAVIYLTVNGLFTDDVGASTTTIISGFSLGATGRTQGSIVFLARYGSAIQYSTTISGAVTTNVYALEFTVERLT